MGKPNSKLLRRGVVLFALVVVVGLIGSLVIQHNAKTGHTVSVTVPQATGLTKGQFVRAGGSPVGKISSIKPIDKGHAARIRLDLKDSVWPLPKGSVFTVRWGGTIDLFNRNVELALGPKGGPPMARDGGDIPASAFKVPVEYGDLLSIFDKPTRTDLKQFLDADGLALKRTGKPLNQALDQAPGVTNQADAVLDDLDTSRDDVKTLVESTGDVVSAVNRADPGLGQLIVDAGTTLNATAADTRSLQAALDRAPGTLRTATDTLHRADGTLDAVTTLAQRLNPGVDQLRAIASPLNHALGTLTTVAPNARATLHTLGTAAPDLTTLLGRVGTVAPKLSSISTQTNTAVDCIRPYAPEIAAFGSLWGSALAGVDGQGKYIRATPTLSLPAPSMAEYKDSAQAVKDFPGTRYAFPRPPGTQAGQPWFLPECGITKDAFDPSKDPEARSFNGLERLLPTDENSPNGNSAASNGNEPTAPTDSDPSSRRKGGH